ncbi:MAG: FkbM family methyltransferase [Rickettsiaceae bacterium]|jgi:FkbM family methyltransferase|nr:FkbM family methyltransferase [Rickettsiaceae bacterium]
MRIKMIVLAIIFTCCTLLAINIKPVKLELSKVYFRTTCPVPRQGGNPNFYAQFYEDYILSIALSNIKNGHYIDVGANSPNLDSVTKHFYLEGWTGINIEPIEKLYDQYLTQRPNDISINKGVSNIEGEIDFYILSSDLMSSGNIDFVNKAKEKGYNYKKETMKVTTLNNILIAHPIAPITFLKIDVEGMEKEVLDGLDLSKHRPSILVIESIRPFSHTKVHEEWETILLKNNFTFVLFDSLNRYYVANENLEELSENWDKASRCYSLANEIYPEYKIENVYKHEVDY